MLTMCDINWLRAEKSLDTKEEKDRQRREIEQHVQDYLAAGGKITYVSDGKITSDSLGFDRLFLANSKKEKDNES